MTEGDFPDVEGAMRTYLRGHADVAALVAQRVFFGVPDQPTWPLVTVRRVAGSDDTSEAPIDHAMLQIDGWGRLFNDADKRKSAHGDKAQADALRRALRKALWQIRGATTVGSVVLYGAYVESDPFLPDPTNDRPRYALTTRVTARAA